MAPTECPLNACLLDFLLSCLLACLLACLPACLRVCLLACLLALVLLRNVPDGHTTSRYLGFLSEPKTLHLSRTNTGYAKKIDLCSGGP